MHEGRDDQRGAQAAAGTTRLRAVLLCALDGASTGAGAADAEAGTGAAGGGAPQRERHDALIADLLRAHGGVHRHDAADGLLALFERPVQALAFALECQRALRSRAAAGEPPLRARIAIHVGEVRLDGDDAVPPTLQASHPVRRTAARLRRLACPGQILLSGLAHALAQRASDELEAIAPKLRWRSHGEYRFEGVPQSISVYEAGEPGIAPLRAPVAPGIARRQRRWYQTSAAHAAGVLLAVGLAAGALQAMLAEPPTLQFAQRDWVVVAGLQNLSGDPRYDSALEGALRVGLEQSRHLNVVGAARVGETMRHMQLPPDTALDRDTAIEVALREGARAVLLPTVAEIGGRVRVSVQIIDPASGLSVFVASADAPDGDALGALDRVLSELRADLGESLTGIASSSEPLERVTTPDLEALRAYSLGVRAAEDGRPDEANMLFARAVELDPGFAAAHARLAAHYLQTGDRARAWQHVRDAAAHRERLTLRERLYVDGYKAFFGTPAEMRARWGELATRFPDAAVAEHNLGYTYLLYENDFANAALHFERAARSPHSVRHSAMETLALTLLAQDRHAEAEHWLAQRSALSRPPVFHVEFDLHLARREYAQAAAALAEPRHTPYTAGMVAHALRQAVLGVELGRPAPAQEELAQLNVQMRQAGLEEVQARAELSRLAVAAWAAGQVPAPALRQVVQDEQRRLDEAATSHDYSAVNHLLIAAVLAARSGATALASEALQGARPHAEGSGFPDREAWLAAARAELALAAGDPTTALEAIRPAQATELYYAHVLALRAQLARGQLEAAAAEADWLLAHRGHMLAEYLALHSALLLNVTATSEALLDAAEAAEAAGDAPRARTLLASATAGWHDADATAAPVARARALQRRVR